MGRQGCQGGEEYREEDPVSTKIYNGFKFRKNYKTLLEIKQWWSSFQEQLRKKQAAAYSKHFIELAVYYKDCDTLGLGRPGPDHSPLGATYEVFYEHQKKLKVSAERDPSFDFGFEICLLPLKSKLLALVYSEHFQEFFANKAGAVDYHYQNQTDRPKEVTSRAWRQRKLDWDEALKVEFIPARNGFTFSSTFEHSSSGDLRKVRIAAPKVRAARFAYSEVLDTLCRKQSRKSYDSFWEAQSWLRATKEGKWVVAKKAEKIAAKLKDLTYADLLVAARLPKASVAIAALPSPAIGSV